MGYVLKKGVVLFQMCGEHFIFPSRGAGKLAPAILSASEEMVSILQAKGEPKGIVNTISPETERKLQLLVRAGFLEEY